MRIASAVIRGGLVLAIAVALVPTVKAREPELVEDVNPRSGSNSSPAGLTNLNGKLLFAATRGDVGRELFVTDTATDATRLLVDIRPGRESSSPTVLAAMGGWLYFSADDGATGVELWRSDGTVTERIADIYPGETGSAPQLLAVVGDTLYFTAGDPDHGRELWLTDGETVTFVEDLDPRVTEDGVPYGTTFYLLGHDEETLYFKVYDYSEGGYVLWSVAGADAAPVPFADPNRTGGISSPLGSVGGALYASGSGYIDSGDGPEYVGTELWKITPSGAELIDLYPDLSGYYGVHNSNPELVAELPGALYIRAQTGSADNEVKNGLELFQITAEGVQPVIDLSPGHFWSDPRFFAVRDGKLYFVARTADHGFSLWAADPAVVDDPLTPEIEGISLFLEFPEVVPFTGGLFSRVVNFGDLPDRTIFQAYNYYAWYSSLWSLDWTTGEVQMLVDLPQSHSAPMGTVGGRVVIRSRTSFSSTQDLYWATDGTFSETRDELAEVEPLDVVPFPSGGNWEGTTEAGGRLYFGKYDAVIGEELFASDGTPAGTGLVADIEATAGSHSDPRILAEINGRVVFSATDGAHGTELWSTTGEPAGTAMIADLNPGEGGLVLSSSGVLPAPGADRDILLFSAHVPGRGYELYGTDGTPGNLTALPEFVPGSGSGTPSFLFERGGWAWFRADTPDDGRELWRTDGETLELRAIWPGTTSRTHVSGGGEYPIRHSGNPEYLGRIGDTIFLRAQSGEDDGREPTGLEPFMLTDAGVELVADLNPERYTYGQYVYTGTDEPYQVGESSYPAYVANLNVGTAAEKIVFQAYDGSTENLYTVDEAGTVEKIVELSPRSSPSSTPLVAVVGSKLFLNHDGLDPELVPDPDIAYSGRTGFELWVWDDAAGTLSLVEDLYPAGTTYTTTYYGEEITVYSPYGASPQPVGTLDDLLLFSASAPDVGRELFVTDGTEAGTRLVADINPLGSSSPAHPIELDGTIYFRANDGFHGYELWKTGGHERDTALVKDIVSGGASGYATPWPIATHGLLYFIASTATHGTELWSTDGTEIGTNEVADLNPGPVSSDPVLFGEYLGSTLLFRADDGTHGRELWRLDAGSSVSVDFFSNGSDVDWVAGKKMQFLISGSHPEGEPLLLKGYLDGVEIANSTTSAQMSPTVGTNPVRAAFRWTPTLSEAGDYELRFTVTDADGGNPVSWIVNLHVAGDSDNDGLPDLWETEGYTTVDGVFVDLPNLTGEYLSEGARPDRPDVFIEVDWMEDGTTSHEPLNQAILWVVRAFRARGVQVHIVVDEPVPFVEELGNDPKAYDWTQFDNFKDAYFTREYEPAFRYCLFAHKLGPSTQSGISRNVPTEADAGASDLIVSLGAWPVQVGVDETTGEPIYVPGGSRSEQAGTFMHELGHNLGLGHGGGDSRGNKPNYLSVMNYLFQFGLPIDGLPVDEEFRRFDYSSVDLPALDENALIEAAGLRSATLQNGQWVFEEITGLDGFRTRWFDQYGNRREQAPGEGVNSPVDWNGDGAISEDPIPFDVTRDFYRGTLGSFDDWANLRFTGGLVGGGGIDLPEVSESEELEIEEARDVYDFEPPDPNPNAPVAVATVLGGYEYHLTDADGLARVALDGGNSYDAEETELTWWWYEDGDLIGRGETFTGAFAPGLNVVTLVVEDSSRKSAPVDVSFSVVSNRAIVVSATPKVLSTVDDELHLVELSVAPEDLVVEVGSVSCNETISGPGPDADWNTGPEASSAYLRATRSGFIERVYTIAYECIDGDRTLTGSVSVVVPAPTRVEFEASLSPSVLWPANHRFVEVQLLVDPEDLDCEITGVTSSQAVEGKGAGKTSPDWMLTDDPTVVLLRAERSGKDGDRVYTVHFTCTDAAGNRAEGTATVLVPHDQGVAPDTGTETVPRDGAPPPPEEPEDAGGNPGGGGDGEAPAAVGDEALPLATGDEAGEAEDAVGDDGGQEAADGGSSDGSGDEDEGASPPEADPSDGASSGIEGGETLGEQAGATNGGTEPAGVQKPEGPESNLSGEEIDPSE